MKSLGIFACLMCVFLGFTSVMSDEKAHVNVYEVYDKSEVCALATFAATFGVTYNTTKKEDVEVSFNIPDNATVNNVTSSCSDAYAVLVIDMSDGNNFTINFGTIEIDNTTWFTIDNMTLGYVLDSKRFPDPSNETHLTVLTTEEMPGTNLAPIGDSYKCDSALPTVLTTFTITTEELHLQPFKVINGTFSDANVCPQDANMTTSAPSTTVTPMSTTLPPPEGKWVVKDEGDNACLIAHFGMEFTIPYETIKNTTENAIFDIPPSATVDMNNSRCAGSDNTSTLVLNFAYNSDNNNLTMKFKKDATTYYTTEITLDYITDKVNFPNASKEGERKSETTAEKLFETTSGQYYSCDTEQTYKFGDGSIETSDVKIQAFDLKDYNFTTPDTCDADLPPKLSTGNWTIFNGTGEHNTTCMHIQMAVQFHIQYLNNDGKNATTHVNLNPNHTDHSGSVCSSNTSATFNLKFYDGWVMTMSFSKTKNNKYNMSHFVLIYTTGERYGFKNPKESKGSAATNETEFSATVGNSYQCYTDQNYTIKDVVLELNEVHIQPFVRDVDDKEGFGAAEDCEADQQTSNIVPIAVGCALAGLVIIVLIAYLIGRRRSKSKGYESV